MTHLRNVTTLEGPIREETLRARDIVAVKTERNAGVNDFVRNYFTRCLMAVPGRHLGELADARVRRIPCVLSGGHEGVLSPYDVVTASPGTARSPSTSRSTSCAS